ncbi:MAG: sigma-70 family RNA polymerase sigma factor [Angelakisella sp.]
MTIAATEERFTELYNIYNGSMYRIAYSVLRDEGLAQDAVQQTFLKIYNEIDRIDEARSAKTRSFVVVLIRNTTIDIYSKSKREQVLYFDDLERTPVSSTLLPEDSAISSQSREEAVDALRSLGEKYAAILILRYCHGYRNKEIAEQLNMSEASVASRIFQAKRLLAKSGWAKALQSA